MTVFYHLLMVLLIGLPFVELSARRMERKYVDGNNYRMLALLIHIIAFTLSEMLVSYYWQVFAISILAIAVTHLFAELCTSNDPKAQERRRQARATETRQHAELIAQRDALRDKSMVIKTYDSPHAHLEMHNDREQLESAGIEAQLHYAMIGFLAVAPKNVDHACEILGVAPPEARSRSEAAAFGRC